MYKLGKRSYWSVISLKYNHAPLSKNTGLLSIATRHEIGSPPLSDIAKIQDYL